MKAFYLPARASPSSDEFAFITNPPKPSNLDLNSDYPRPTLPIKYDQTDAKLANYRTHTSSYTALSNQHQYILEVHSACPTREELTWAETLNPARFNEADNIGPIPCHDFVGKVIEVYSPAEFETPPKFKLGDLVAGFTDFDRNGAAAEQIAVFESEIAQVPSGPKSDLPGEPNWTELVATLPIASLTAWQALFEYGGLLPDFRLDSSPEQSKPSKRTAATKRVLITGASGAVGIQATQLATHCGSVTQPVQVYALCSARGRELLSSVTGAHVILTDAEPDNLQSLEALFKDNEGPFDLILDCSGPAILGRVLSFNHDPSVPGESRVLAEDTRIVSVATPLTPAAVKTLAERVDETTLEAVRQCYSFFIVRPEARQLDQVIRLLEGGQIKAWVGGRYPFGQVKEAFEECETRKKSHSMKVVIKVKDV